MSSSRLLSPHVLASDRSGIAVIVAFVLAPLALVPMTTDRGFVVLSAGLVLALGALGIALRRLRVTPLAVLGAQVGLLLVALFVLCTVLGDPGINPILRVADLYGGGVTHLRSTPAPMTPDPGVTVLLVTTVAVLMVWADQFASTLQTPVWVLVPLFALYLVPALGLRSDISFWAFLPPALGFLVVLLAEGINRTVAWNRGLSDRGGERETSAVAGLAARLGLLIGVPVVIASLLLALVIPTLTQSGWGFERPQGSDGPLTMSDPTLDLRRNLTQPEDRQILTYRSDDASGEYLRLASLPLLTDRGWTNTGIQLQGGSSLPRPPGLSDPPAPHRTTVRIGDYNSEYLPLPWAPTSFTAPGEWSHDTNSLMVLATGADRATATRGLDYSAESISVVPDGPGLSRASAGTPPDANVTAALPAGLPNDLIDLSLKVTAGQQTPALKAAAIQNYLRSDRFTYSTEPLPGTGYQALENFLLRDHRGYCEQFAGAMAMMARVVGIPSRVAVGFQPGERSGDGWAVSIRDSHAWPELYFEGYGWVRFEPTPSVGVPPPWTVVDDGSRERAPSPSSTPSQSVQLPTEEPTAPTPEATPEAPTAPAPEANDHVLERVLLGAGLAVVLAGLLSLPAAWRARLRRQRLGATTLEEQVDGAWDEVRDSCLDAGQGWPSGSPRSVAETVAARLDEPAASRMRELGLLRERSLYAASTPPSTDLGDAVHDIRRGVAARNDGRLARFLADAWPRSVWRRVAERLRLR